ncbi:drug resistance transporter, EmrB/QacA subfamily [Desulfotomaculum arcticum]|uniref:Drug resistance transporter, EmrB/QacA subfamily n=1 Tax=Desulfotruncus arcticus DSM 17038 TaxID=1121424 RepID=A0A1I2PHJ4_9FIRM|nr:MDR family MFS transporter [Desulfotruncus arcticus]SFG15524.1 drug resistance transporter, EmrB/QacA subfamily [Desulfotomaculum arcticum] [Desulfotruncus arcticus DSM 17038]
MVKKTRRKMVSIAVMVSVLLVAIDTTIVTTAMPNIVKQLSGLKLISWVFAIYLLTTSVTTPIFGKLADLFGRKSIFIFGVALFVIGSMLSGAAQSMQQLIWFRAFQGIGAGAVMPLTLTIFGDLYTGEERAKMQGLFSSVWGIAGLLGPLAGGLFVDHISWRWIFYINVPVGIAAIGLILVFLHETQIEKTKKNIDYWGAALFTLAMGSLLYVLISGGESYAWNSATIISLFAVAAVFLILFIVVEAKAKEPMLPLSLFKSSVIVASNAVGFMASCVLIGVNVYLPVWIQTLLGHSATSSGLALMPMSFAWPLASTLAGQFMYRVGSKATAVFGAVLITAGSAWLVFIHTGSPYWYFVGIMIVIGFGMGCSSTPLTVLIQSAVGWNMRGAATASNMFSRSLGQTVGIAVFGTVFNNALNKYVQSHIPGGWQGGDISNALMSPGANIPASVLEQLRHGMAQSLHLIFILGFAISIVTLLASFMLPAHSKVLAQQQAD